MNPGLPVVIGSVRRSVAVGEDLHLVGLRVDLVDVRVADLEVDAARLLAVDAVAGGQAVEVEVDRHVGAGLPVGRGAVVRLGVAHPVPRAALRRRARDLHVLLEERLVRHGEVEGHHDRHPDAHGLTVERGDGGVGLLVEREVDGVEAAGALDRTTVAARGGGVDDVVGARLETVGRRPGGALDLAGQRARRRGDLDRVEGAALGTHRERGVDRDGGGVGEARRETHRLGLRRLGRRARSWPARAAGAALTVSATRRGGAGREAAREHQQGGGARRTTQWTGRAVAHATKPPGMTSETEEPVQRTSRTGSSVKGRTQ